MLLSSAEIYIVYFSLGWCQSCLLPSLLLARSLLCSELRIVREALVFFLLKNCIFRSMLAEPLFTYSYGYSFGILILSFLLSEFTGLTMFLKTALAQTEISSIFSTSSPSFERLYNSYSLSLSGICAIFQFIYHHQHKWDQIEKNIISESLGFIKLCSF